MRKLVTAFAVGLVAATNAPLASAVDTVVHVPATIASDCSRDVSSELADFINALPGGSTVTFTPAGCYRVERQMNLSERVGLVLDGQGATLLRTEPTPPELRYPNANGFLRLLKWSGGGVRDLNIQGINVVSDKEELGTAYGAWDQSMEFDAGINVRGGSDLVLENLHIDGTYGDGIQIQRWGGNPRNIVVRDVVIGHNGRQGISISAATGVLIERVNILGSRRGGIDIEPAADTMVAENIEIRDSTIASWLLAFPSQGNGLANHVYVHDNTVTRTGVPFVKVYSTAGLQRTDWRVVNNTVAYGLGSTQPAMVFDNVTDVLIDGNVIRLKDGRSQLAVGLRNGATATITNNWFKGALSHPDYVDAAPGTSWLGGNNSVTEQPPSPVRWVAPVPPPALPTNEPPPSGSTAGEPAPAVPVSTPTNSTPQQVTPTLRLRTTLTLDVREPVRRGDVLRARGRLLRASASSTDFLAYSGRTVLIQFRKEGAASYRTVTTVRSGTAGWFSSGGKLTARTSGAWRAVFKGDSLYRPSASTRDIVGVKARRTSAPSSPTGGLILGMFSS